MKTPDETKRRFAEAIEEPFFLAGCVDHDLIEARGKAPASMADALAYIRQLEAERDAAVSELIGTCQVCRWEETEKCASCHFNADAWNVHESNWEWRGLPEPPKEAT